MNYIKSFFIFAALSFTGEILSTIIPIPIPASIYGFLILIILLTARILKPSLLRPVADFLLNIMPLTFIAPGVRITESIPQLGEIILPLLISVTAGTAVVIICSGKSAEIFEKKEKEKKK